MTSFQAPGAGAAIEVRPFLSFVLTIAPGPQVEFVLANILYHPDMDVPQLPGTLNHRRPGAGA